MLNKEISDFKSFLVFLFFCVCFIELEMNSCDQRIRVMCLHFILEGNAKRPWAYSIAN